jgi:hypothetical protein
MLVAHTLKRSAGIGTGVEDVALEEKVEDLADALVVIIAATGFLEVCLRTCFAYDPFYLPTVANCWFLV